MRWTKPTTSALMATLALTIGASVGATSASAETFEVKTKAGAGTMEVVSSDTSLTTENGTTLKCKEASASGDLKEGTGIAGNEIGLILMATWNKGAETCEGPVLTKFGVVTETLTKPWILLAHELLNGKDLIDGLLHSSLIHVTGGCSFLACLD